MGRSREVLRDPWRWANDYLGWFAVDCHFTPDQVYDMPWPALVSLTLLADRRAERVAEATEE